MQDLKRNINLVECPRDAMQGWSRFIATETKIAYLNALLKVGFHTLDFGSFVSPKAIPQMADTREVLSKLEVDQSNTRLLAIVANYRGAEEAASHAGITYIGYPFSISETFQRRNTNTGITESYQLVEKMLALCGKASKELVVYISMGFGNPYGDDYSPDLVYEWVTKFEKLGIRIISLADTVGLATPELVQDVTHAVISSFSALDIGVHLHADPGTWKEKTSAALSAGCLRFDGALKGIGGCPMANDELVGNLDTEKLIPFFSTHGYSLNIDTEALRNASSLASSIFLN